MGIPVVSLTGNYSFATAHPFATGMFIVGLLVTAVALYDCGHSFSHWLVRNHPRGAARLRVGMWALLLVGGTVGLWGAFKTQPSLLEQIQRFAEQASQQKDKP